MSQEGFLSRWSRRKVEAKAPAAPMTEVHAVEPIEEPAAPSLPEPVTAEPEQAEQEIRAEDLGLPAIETLDKDSDYTGFMKDGVPELLKKQALRALWKSDPIFANLDGMNEYDEDFTKFKPLAEGVANELKKLMEKNSRPKEPEPEPDPEAEAEIEGLETSEAAIQKDKAPPAEEDIQPEVKNENDSHEEEESKIDKPV